MNRTKEKKENEEENTRPNRLLKKKYLGVAIAHATIIIHIYTGLF